MTNADKIRSMTDEELARFLEFSESYLPNGVSWEEYLKSYAEDDEQNCGRWVETDYPCLWECSKCKGWVGVKFNYCPNCGSKNI